MDSLRLILMLMGAVIILAVYLYSRYKKIPSQKLKADSSALDASLLSKTQNPSVAASTTNATVDTLMDDNGVIVDPSVYSFESKQNPHDSYLEDELSELGGHIKIDDAGFMTEADYSGKQSAEITSSRPERSQKQSRMHEGEEVEKVMVIYLVAQPEQGFSGSDIRNMAETEGLQFGADCYFHRYSNPREKTGSIFGIANILEPGLFDSLDRKDFSTPGLVFFQQLSSAGNALEAFDELLKSVIQFKDKLDGRLQDSGRRPLNKNAMIKLREEVAVFSQKNPVASI